MQNNLPQKELIIAVIEKGNSILMRKKPAGSPPYKETWYLFGCEKISNQDDPTTLKNYLKAHVGIDVDVSNKPLSLDFEIKLDHDGIEKKFIYFNLLCKYLGGTPKIPQGAELVEWLPKDKLKTFDMVPPSVKLFKNLGYF